MTQEELDALMNGGVEDIVESTDEENFEEPLDSEEEGFDNDDEVPAGYNDDTAHNWPLPATDENKMVHQLDDVTKESEEKATEIFDIIENISNDLMDKEEDLTRVSEVLQSNIELFTTLSEKFPNIEAFKTQLESNTSALADANSTLETLQDSGNSIMSVMDIMQYQDIHRQKIERVINTMVKISGMMSDSLNGVDVPANIAPSAKHIDNDDGESIDDDEIEKMIAENNS